LRHSDAFLLVHRSARSGVRAREDARFPRGLASRVDRGGEEVKRTLFIVFAASVGALALGACAQDMYDQPRYEPYEASAFFADGRGSRSPVPGTVPRGQLAIDELSRAMPAPITMSMLERGRERYDIYCSPCHDRAGTGQGVIVQRGMKTPPTFHQDRLRN